MSYSVYSIKTLINPQYYGLRHTNITKVVYFRHLKDAQKMAAFLSSNNQNNNLYDYKQPDNIYKYNEFYEIEKQSKDFMNFTLALNDIGFHECEIVDDIIYCMDTGIFDLHEEVKSQYISERLVTLLKK